MNTSRNPVKTQKWWYRISGSSDKVNPVMNLRFNSKDIFHLLSLTYKEWTSKDVFGKSAAVAYYAVFSLPGLLFIIISVVGLFIDDTKTIQKISSGLTDMISAESAEGIVQIIRDSNSKDKSLLTSMVSIGSLLFGATGLFIQLQKSLNDIWYVKKTGDFNIIALIKDRATSLGIVIAIGFLLLLSFVLSTMISSVGNWITSNFSEDFLILVKVANLILSIVVITLLFATIFKVLPDIDIEWKVVWLGAFITSILFTIGKALIAFYLSEFNPGDTFGAAGSIILFLLWVSYSCLILFFGATFTQVYVKQYGYRVRPSDHAEKIPGYAFDQEENLQQKLSEA